MTNLLEIIVNEFGRRRKPPLFVLWDWSIPDESCVDYILKHGHCSHCITYMDLNNAFRNPENKKMILSSEAKNDVARGF